MINPNDLRIGNWVHVQYNKPYQIEHLNQTSSGPYVSMDMNAITISPEIIAKTGFIKVQENPAVWEYEGFKIIEAAGGSYHFYFNEPYGKMITYIHELQNVYHALYGNELPVEL